MPQKNTQVWFKNSKKEDHYILRDIFRWGCLLQNGNFNVAVRWEGRFSLHEPLSQLHGYYQGKLSNSGDCMWEKETNFIYRQLKTVSVHIGTQLILSLQALPSQLLPPFLSGKLSLLHHNWMAHLCYSSLLLLANFYQHELFFPAFLFTCLVQKRVPI